MKEILREFGLSENEVTVYLTLIKTDSATANRVSALTGLKRSTTYDTLQSLVMKGIVSSTQEGRVMYYHSADPEKLVHLLDERKKRIQSIVPEIKKLQSISQKRSGVIYYEGKRGVVTVLNDIFDDSPKEFLFIGSRKMAKVPLAHYPDNFVRKRVEHNILAKGLLAKEDEQDTFVEDAQAQKLSDFIFSKKLDGATADMFVYGDKVSFFTNKEDPAGIIINNKEIAQFMRTIYTMIK